MTPEQGEWVVKAAIAVPTMTVVGYGIGIAKVVLRRAVIRRASANLAHSMAEGAHRVVDNDPRTFRGPGGPVRR